MEYYIELIYSLFMFIIGTLFGSFFTLAIYRIPRKQDIVNNGEIAVIIIDDEATLKRFYYYKEQNLVILKPENSKYKDIILSGEELNNVKVIGKAVFFQSDID